MPKRRAPRPSDGQLTLFQALGRRRPDNDDEPDEVDDQRPGGQRRSGRTTPLPGRYREPDPEADDREVADDDDDVAGESDGDWNRQPVAKEARSRGAIGKS